MTFSELHKRAIKLAGEITDDDALRQVDLTEVFFNEIELTVKGHTNGGLINFNCNGQPGSGKSTVMGALVMHINALLGKETTIDHILANQIVYTQVMRRIQEVQNVCLGIDEYDEVGDTGFNTTIDKAALNHYSDLHRANYVHKVACSPQELLDKNCYLLLDVLHARKEEKRTFCTISYIFTKGGMRTTQLLGHVWIDVSAFVDSDLNAKYTNRKMQRLQMFSKYGLKTEKDIFVANIILDAYDELAPLSKIKKIDSNFAEFQIDMSTRKLRGMNSWFASNKFTKDLLALLSYKKFLQDLNKDIWKLNDMMEKDPSQDMTLKIESITQLLGNLKEQEDAALQYWRNASSLEPLYMSNYGNGT